MLWAGSPQILTAAMSYTASGGFVGLAQGGFGMDKVE